QAPGFTPCQFPDQSFKLRCGPLGQGGETCLTALCGASGKTLCVLQREKNYSTTIFRFASVSWGFSWHFRRETAKKTLSSLITMKNNYKNNF
ncbi:hypothetical protein, partial [Alcaligenes sp. YSL9]|uniref:hypothetical protein n=1 Tax=Alcaligenes sp. YSL9 TaxID=2939596 RepID=UPI00266D9F67